MNANAIRVLFRYNQWAYDRLWESARTLDNDQFTRDTGYSVGSVRDHLIHLASVDARWWARVRGNPVPKHLDPFEYGTLDAAATAWDVVYRDIEHALDNLTDDHVTTDISYTARGGDHTDPAWKILLHMLNHGTDHRAQVLYALHKLGAPTFEQDFIYYLRDEQPPRQKVKVQVGVMKALFEYDSYATARIISESLAGLSESQLDHDFGYSHGSIRRQVEHLLKSSHYWLARAFQKQISNDAAAMLGAGSRLMNELNDADLLDPIDYVTGGGLYTANIRWEMLWHLINHGTDHRAQLLAFLHGIGAETLEQDYIIYVWDYEL